MFFDDKKTSLLLTSLILGIALVLSACGRVVDDRENNSGRTMCTMISIAGLSIGISFQEPIKNFEELEGLQIVIQNGIYSETYKDDENIIPQSYKNGKLGRIHWSSFDEGENTYYLPAAYDRAGTYDIFISHPDYASVVKRGVNVEDGGCHPITESVNLVLSK